MSADLKPVPELTELNRPFFDAAAEGRLAIQGCVPCGHHWFPPARRCPECLSGDVEWLDVTGRATLWSWIRMHQKYFAGFADDLPYVVGFVQLDEGPWMIAGIVGAPLRELSCDQRLRVVFEPTAGGLVLPKFTPDDPADDRGTEGEGIS
jgi:uncharacterized protein